MCVLQEGSSCYIFIFFIFGLLRMVDCSGGSARFLPVCCSFYVISPFHVNTSTRDRVWIQP